MRGEQHVSYMYMRHVVWAQWEREGGCLVFCLVKFQVCVHHIEDTPHTNRNNINTKNTHRFKLYANIYTNAHTLHSNTHVLLSTTFYSQHQNTSKHNTKPTHHNNQLCVGLRPAKRPRSQGAPSPRGLLRHCGTQTSCQRRPSTGVL